MIKVKNIKGSDFYSGSGWLEYWEKTTGRPAVRCSAVDCHQSRLFCTLVGAHVIKVDSSDRHYYIVPLCSGCNKRTDEFWVDEELVPCPSNL